MKINAIDKNGDLGEYDVILTYHSDEFNSDYVVYTDNTYNSNSELQIYINEYNPQCIETTVKSISNTLEYNKIKTEVDNILLIMKNEANKLDAA